MSRSDYAAVLANMEEKRRRTQLIHLAENYANDYYHYQLHEILTSLLRDEFFAILHNRISFPAFDIISKRDVMVDFADYPYFPPHYLHENRIRNLFATNDRDKIDFVWRYQQLHPNEQVDDYYRIHEMREKVETEDEIKEIVDTLSTILLSSSSPTMCNVYIRNVTDPVRLLQSLLIQHPECVTPQMKRITEMLTDGFDNSSTLFWTISSKPIDQTLSTCLVWSVISATEAKQYAAEANSYPLLFTFPEMLYSSRRPKTDMTTFRVPSSNTYTDENELEGISYIPVTRYASGMSRGLYHKDDFDVTSMCGTFYYYENESTTLLAFTTRLEAFNKIDAINKMIEMIREKESEGQVIIGTESLITESEEIITDLMKNPVMSEWMNSKYPEDFSFTIEEYRNMLPNHVTKNMIWNPDSGRSGDGDASNKRNYVGDRFLYAAEDSLDQPMCDIARKLEIDVIILTHMIGSHQVVTEVCDTRDRMLSFSSLFYKI